MFDKIAELFGLKKKENTEMTRLVKMRARTASQEFEKVDVVSKMRTSTTEQHMIVGSKTPPKEISRREQLLNNCGYIDCTPDAGHGVQQSQGQTAEPVPPPIQPAAAAK